MGFFSHAYRESISKRQIANRMVDWINILLLFGVYSQSSGAENTGVNLLQIVAFLGCSLYTSASTVKQVAIWTSVCIQTSPVTTGYWTGYWTEAGPALPVICSQVRVKKHGDGQSSGGSGAGSMGGSRGGGGDENGRIGRGIDEGRRNGMGGGAQRRGNEDDDDNDGRHMVGDVENGRNARPEDIANTFLPIILQSIAIITAIDGAQLSTTGTVIRSLSMMINLAGFICCTLLLWPLHTNRRLGRILNPRISGILSSLGSALAVLGFISMMAIYLPF